MKSIKTLKIEIEKDTRRLRDSHVYRLVELKFQKWPQNQNTDRYNVLSKMDKYNAIPINALFPELGPIV